MESSIQDQVSAMSLAQQQASDKQADRQEAIRNTQTLVQAVQQSVALLVRYLDSRDIEVDVKNFPSEMKVPEIQKVVSELQALKTALKPNDHVSADDQKTHALLNQLLKAVQNLPTETPEIPEGVEEVTVKNMPDYSSLIKDVISAVKAIEVNVAAPVVDVKAPQVNVDLKSLETQFKALQTAVEAIKLVVPENDDKPVIEAVRTVTEAIRNLRFPVPNFTSSFSDTTGKPSSASLDSFGAVPTASPPKALQVDDLGSTIYVGEAAIGSATSGAVWRIKRFVTSGSVTSETWADGNSQYDNIWDNRLSLSYA